MLPILITACAPSDEINVALDAYHEVHVLVTERGLDVRLGDDEGVVQYAPCPIASALLQATLGDVVMSYERRGGKIGDEPGDDVSDNVCGAPRFHLDPPLASGPHPLVIAESAALSIQCRLPDLVTPRALGADTWTWKPGTIATIRWTPVDDAASWEGFGLSLAHLTPDGFVDRAYDLTDVTMGGGLLRFTVPQAPAGPDYVVAVQPRLTVPCGGASATLESTQISFAARHDVTIAP